MEFFKKACIANSLIHLWKLLFVFRYLETPTTTRIIGYNVFDETLEKHHLSSDILLGKLFE